MKCTRKAHPLNCSGRQKATTTLQGGDDHSNESYPFTTVPQLELQNKNQGLIRTEVLSK